jgi:hypothetical protein
MTPEEIKNLQDYYLEQVIEQEGGTTDEYVGHSLFQKKLESRNNQIKPVLIARKRIYLPSSDNQHYLSLCSSPKYEYSDEVKKLEQQAEKLAAKIKAKKEKERDQGVAKTISVTKSLRLYSMSPEVFTKIANGDDIYQEPDDL